MDEVYYDSDQCQETLLVNRDENEAIRVCNQLSDHLGHWGLILPCKNKKWFSTHTSVIPLKGQGNWRGIIFNTPTQSLVESYSRGMVLNPWPFWLAMPVWAKWPRSCDRRKLSDRLRCCWLEVGPYQMGRGH